MLDFIETFIISAFYIIIFANLILYCIKTIDCDEWAILQPFGNAEEGDVKEVTSPDIMNDAVSGLVNMGFKKTEARVAVASKTQDKVYTDPLELIKDAVSRD